MLLNPNYVERVLDTYLNVIPGVSDIDQRCMTNLFYHTRRHVENMLTGFEFHVLNRTWNPLPGPVVIIGEAAILFHDIVYIPGSYDNEERSASFARKSLCEARLPEQAIKLVEELILSTIPFTRSHPGVADKDIRWIADLIHDLDWIMFSNYDVMKSNEVKLLREAIQKAGSFFNGDKSDFQKNQLRFYEKLLEHMDERDGLYRTEELSCYNEIAKTNVETRISELKFGEDF